MSAPSYTAFITAWNNALTGSLPASTTGTVFTGLTTTQERLNALNAWQFTGAVPSTLFVTGAQLANCINWTEFSALTAAQQQSLLQLCAIPGQLLGGSGNTALLTDGMFLAFFTNHTGPTIVALTALAQATVEPWWQSQGYLRPFDLGDCAAAGVS